MSKADVFEKIGASVPVNATAGRVVSKGARYEERAQFGPRHVHSELPLPTQPIPRRTQQGFTDLTGAVFGRFRVVGLAAEAASRWVVRCSCGCYEHRSAKAIRNPRNTTDCCSRCNRLEQLKRNYARFGGRPVEDFV